MVSISVHPSTAIEDSISTSSVYIGGSAKVDNLNPLADLGVWRMVINPPGTNPAVIVQRLEKFQEKVISRS